MALGVGHDKKHGEGDSEREIERVIYERKREKRTRELVDVRERERGEIRVRVANH